MICPRCLERMIWQNDYMCDEWALCSCKEGLVTIWNCSNCNANIVMTIDCKELEE